MRVQPTQVELLDIERPGLREHVDHRLDALATLEAIAREVKEKFGCRLALSTLSSYKQRRWWPAKLGLEELKEIFRAVEEELGGQGISDSTRALIFQKLSEAMRTGAKLDPHFLLKEQRLWAEHTAKLDVIANDKRRLEIELEQVKQAREAERREIQEAAGDAKDPSEVVRRIREIYGIGEARPEIGDSAATKPRPAPALSGEVGPR